MNKLTLSIPPATLRRAKAYAKRHHTSVSALVTQLFDSIARDNADAEAPRGAVTASIIGLIELPRSSKADLLSSAITDKHLRR